MTPRPLFLMTITAATTLFAAFASAQPVDPRDGRVSQAAYVPSTESQDEQSAVVVRDGLLTVRGDRPASLVSVLSAIAQQANLEIIGLDAVQAQWVSMKELTIPLETALRQLLTDYDAFFLYASEGPSAPLTTIWIYPGGQGRNLAPVPPNVWAGTRELEERLRSGDPHVRANALAGLVEREGALALNKVLEALSDNSDEVRTAAVEVAVSSSLGIPAETLFAVALSDPSPQVRLLTLQAVAEHPAVRGVAEQAQFDPDPHVRTQARQILRQFSTASASGDRTSQSR
jgi:hypothetical protein